MRLASVLLFALTLAAQTYSVGGVVVNSVTNAPLARVTLSLALTDDRANTLYAAVSDEAGKFLVTGVPAGKYSLKAQRNGFSAQELDHHGNYSSAVVVGPNTDASHILFRLLPSTSLTVAVLDEDNQPIRQSHVHLFCKRIQDGERRVALVGEAFTNDAGRASFRSLEPGTYYALVQAQPWYAQRTSELTFSPEGLAPDPARSPLEVTYPLTWYGGGSDLSSAAPIQLEVGTHPTVAVNLQPVPGARVRIPLPFEPENGNQVFVQVLADQPDAMAIPVTVPQQYLGDAILVSGLAPGRYDFMLQNQQRARFEKGNAPPAGMTELSRIFVNAEVTGDMTLPLTATPPVTVSGRIITGLHLPPRGENILLIPAASVKGESNIAMPLDERLGFKGAEMVTPGRYRIETSFPMTEVTSVAINGQAAKPGNVVMIPAGDISLTATIGIRNISQVNGFVIDKDKPRAGVAVYLWPEGGIHSAIGNIQDQSDSDGSFSLEVRAGKYIGVAIEDGWEMEYAKPEVMAPYLARGTPIDAVAGKKVQVRLEVQPRQ